MLKLGRNCVHNIFSNLSFRRVFQYTTSAINAESSNFTVDYLVNSLGFSKEKAILASSKVSPLRSSEKPDSVVNLLKTSGFNETQIQTVVNSVPKILSYDVDKTLKPKLKAFQDFGLHGTELADVISAHPYVFVRAVDRHIIPTLEVLKSLFGDKLTLLEALKKSCWMLAPAIRRTAPLNVALLKSYGLSVDRIRTMFFRKSKYFALDPKWLQSILIRVEEKIGIPRDSAMFFHGICVIGGMSEQSLETKFKIFKSYGWSESDILTLARRNPHGLSLSESKLRRCLNFFMKELGHQPLEIASQASILTFSLEKRVIPRNEVIKVLKEKKLIKPTYRITSCLVVNELQFLNKFVLPYQEEVLDLYTDNMRKVGSTSMITEAFLLGWKGREGKKMEGKKVSLRGEKVSFNPKEQTLNKLLI